MNGNPGESRRAWKKSRLCAADVIKKNCLPSSMSNSDLLSKLHDARVIDDKNTAEHYSNDLDKKEFVMMIKQEPINDLDEFDNAFESIVIKMEPEEQDSEQLVPKEILFDVRSSLLKSKNIIHNGTGISEYFGVKLECSDEMIMDDQQPEQLDDKSNITIFDEPIPFIPKLELNQSLSGIISQNSDEREIAKLPTDNDTGVSGHGEEKCYCCNDCSCKFLKKNELRSHIRLKHTKVIRGGCKKSRKLLPFSDELELHCNNCATSTNQFYESSQGRMCFECARKLCYKCRNCKKVYPNLGSANTHVRTVCQPSKFFKCIRCDYFGVRKCNLNDHIRRVHSKEQDETSHGLLSEGASATDQFTVISSSGLSKIDYQKKNSLKDHLKIEYNCDDCNFKAMNKTNIRTHILKEHVKHSMFCSKCGVSFKLLRYFKLHKLFCGTVEFECKFCPKRWLICGKTIKKHLRTHTDKLVTKTLEEVYLEIVVKVREKKRQMLKIFNEENKKKGNTVGIMVTDDMYKIYCGKCKKVSDVVRQNHRRSTIIVNICPHCNGKGKYKCKQCGKLSENRSTIKCHIRSHILRSIENRNS